MKHIVNWIRNYLYGSCPRCGAIGTFKERTDTGLLLEFSDIWKECSKCGHKSEWH